jgi:hypothetical protein
VSPFIIRCWFSFLCWSSFFMFSLCSSSCTMSMHLVYASSSSSRDIHIHIYIMEKSRLFLRNFQRIVIKFKSLWDFGNQIICQISLNS